MNEKMTKEKAREILESPFSEDVIISPWDKDLHLDGKAKGYLEAIEKAKGLEEVIKKFIEFCVCETESDQFSKEAKEALAKWEEEK